MSNLDIINAQIREQHLDEIRIASDLVDILTGQLDPDEFGHGPDGQALVACRRERTSDTRGTRTSLIMANGDEYEVIIRKSVNGNGRTIWGKI